MDAAKLEKLAKLIREYAHQVEANKQQKLASITIAATGLELLRRKLQ
tara:strand:+ start:1060 stop:1200 length:141 start_codon:yes stop_codon:yes gene_type:complete